MKKYSGNYASKEQLLSEMDIIKRSWKTAGGGRRSWAQFISQSQLWRGLQTPYLHQEGHCWDQHLPLPLAEPEHVLGLPRHSKEQDPPQGSPSAGAVLHVWKLELFPPKFSQDKCCLSHKPWDLLKTSQLFNNEAFPICTTKQYSLL